MERWQRQFIRSLFPCSASRLQIERAFIVKNPHIPRFLYKYRGFKDAHIDALWRGVLYMSSPDRFNDPFDTTVFFDPSRFVVENLPASDFVERATKLDQAVRDGMRWHPQLIKNPIRQAEWLRRTVADLLQNEAPEIRDRLVEFMEGWHNQQHREMRKRVSAWFRSSFSVLSLSADPTSILMWSHYSSSHQGFCIEYDFEELLPHDLRRRLCYPVLYRRKKTDATRYMADTGATDFNNLFGQYLCLLKDASWAYEKEWRIVHALGPSYANREIEMPKPSAILLGSAARPDDVKGMEEFCRTKGITLKQAIQSDSSSEIIISDLISFHGSAGAVPPQKPPR